MTDISLLTARALTLLLLVGGLLTPYHMAPWRTAFQEFAVLFALLFFCLSLAIEKSVLQLPSLKWPVAMLTLGLFSLLTFAIGNPLLTESHYLFLIYIAALYLAVSAGSLCANNNALKISLSAALALVAVGQIATSLQQWLGSVTTISFDNWWSTTGSAGGRANGNINQANNYGTLVIWGYLAWLFVLEYLDRRKQIISTFTVSLVAIFFSFGLVLGQSRTSILSLVIVTCLGMFYSQQFSHRIRFAAISFLSGVGIFWFLQPAMSHLLFGDEIGAAVRTFNGSDLRFPAWTMFLTASTDSVPHFFFGRGWGSIRSVHAVVAGTNDYFPDLGQSTFGHTHNVFLDVLVSFGLIGVLMLSYFSWKVIRYFFGRGGDSSDFYFWAMLIALFVHANLELPHWYGYFIWPAAFIFGVLVKPTGGFVVRRSVALPVLLAMIGLSAFAFNRYLKFEMAYGAYSIELAQKGRIVKVVDVDTSIYPGLSETLNVASINISKGLTQSDFQRLVQVAEFSPSSYNVSRAYYASAFFKDINRYEFFSRVACRMSGYELAARIHSISMTIPVEMVRRKIQPNCSLATDPPKI